MNNHADVAVIGLGTMGSLATWQLAQKGLNVIGFEQFGIGHDRAAYGGGSRRFRIATPFAEETPFTYSSYFLFKELEQTTGKQFLSNSGSLTIGDPNSDNVKSVIDSLQKYNLTYEVYNRKEAIDVFPQHKLLSDEVIVWEKTGGVIRPEQVVISAVNQARILGANINPYTPVQEIKSTSKGVEIVTESDQYYVDKVVITTGAWANKLIPELNNHFVARRIMLTWFMPENPEQYTEYNFPNFTRLSNGIHMQGTPAVDGRLVRVTNNSKNITESMIKIEDPDTFDKNVSLKYAKSVGEQIVQLLPNLNPDPVRISPYIDGFTEDGLPVVGITEENKNIILVCGFSGQGFSQAAAMGEIATDLVTDNKTSYNISHLSPKRFCL